MTQATTRTMNDLLHDVMLRRENGSREEIISLADTLWALAVEDTRPAHNFWAELAELVEDSLGTPKLPAFCRTCDGYGSVEDCGPNEGCSEFMPCESFRCLPCGGTGHAVSSAPASLRSRSTVSGPQTLSPEDVLARQAALGEGVRFHLETVDADMMRTAKAYLTSYDGSFDWLLRVQASFHRSGNLTRAETAGVCNCIAGDVKRKLSAERRRQITGPGRHEDRNADRFDRKFGV